jgi:hypothetical protein
MFLTSEQNSSTQKKVQWINYQALAFQTIAFSHLQYYSKQAKFTVL